ncbi:MAG: hypothetical protein ACFCU4_09550 [Puniceicoccaceae bacterium]
MRTTLSISEDLLREAKRVALERDISLGEVVEDALRTTLLSRAKGSSSGKVEPLKTFCGSGVRPGVDLTSSAELLALMEDK